MKQVTVHKPIYFIPQTGMSDVQLVEWAGLRTAIGGMNYTRREVYGGPEGKRGFCLCAYDLEREDISPYTKQIGFFPDKQQWFKFNDGKYWIGFYPDAKPGPLDLQRPVLRRGHAVEMVDGSVWTIPAIHPIDGFPSTLPESLRIDENGNLCREAMPKYKAVQAAADSLYEFFLQGGTYDYQAMIEAVELGMSVNYQVGCHETSALGLFSTENIRQAAYAMVDGPVWDEWLADVEEAQKKTDEAIMPDGSDIASGETEDSPDTSQPISTSTVPGAEP